MRAASKFVFTLIVAGTFSTTALAAPDAEAGRKFAQVECGGCHVVTDRSKKEPPPREYGVTPPFKTIAHDPAMTDDKIRETLRLPHGSMANLLISERDTLNIIAYITSLRH